jgi:hypothetical protein
MNLFFREREPFRHSYQLSQGACFHLVHDTASMDLHGDLTDSNLSRDLFV